ncbi:MAG TPA: hypothetical protein VKU80_19065 [Planctomycetota bacterium]|nr:hypothetical protein [Planctomycetota bacterium]
MRVDRRTFLGTGAGLVGSSVLPSAATASAVSAAGPRLKLSLAAYAMRKYLDLKAATMTLEEFAEKAAEWHLEAIRKAIG